MTRRTPRRGSPRTENSTAGLFIRFGKWPEDERSVNHVEGGKEDGVSVWRVRLNPKSRTVEVLLPATHRGGWGSLDTFNSFVTKICRGVGRSIHLVAGDVVGEGLDGEPLLRNVYAVADLHISDVVCRQAGFRGSDCQAAEYSEYPTVFWDDPRFVEDWLSGLAGTDADRSCRWCSPRV